MVPLVVVAVGPDRVVAWLGRGTEFLAPADRDGRQTRVIPEEAGLVRVRWNDTAGLHILPRGHGWSAMYRWGTSFDDPQGWYVNFQEPIRATAIGFDTMDQTLDMVVPTDLSRVELKDSDELDAWTAAGFYSVAERDAVRAAADGVASLVAARAAPFGEPWSQFRPDPAWLPPALDDRWATVPLASTGLTPDPVTVWG